MGGARRNPRGKSNTSPRERERDAAGERGEHRHVEARDADEVSNPGPVEDAPLRLGDGALIADGERDDHARVRRVGQRRDNALPDRFARAEHDIRHSPGVVTASLPTADRPTEIELYAADAVAVVEAMLMTLRQTRSGRRAAACGFGRRTIIVEAER
jgi:hypothetical protein